MEVSKIVNSQSIVPSERIELVHSGEDYFARLEDIILKAQREIHFQTYIFKNDATGKKIAAALKEAASRKVRVYLLPDAYGSSSLPDEFIADLIQHGIDFRFFAPFFSNNSFYLGRRLHHKVVVVDGSVALIGGINISDKYRGTKTKEPWLDYAVQVEGKLSEQLRELCRAIYFRKYSRPRKRIKFTFHQIGDATAHFLQNDWLERRSQVFNAYIKSIRNSKQQVTIVASYFLPGRKLTKALKKASLSGVKTKMILSGISDIPLIRRAAYYVYTSLLDHNIELYEWSKSILHGKATVVDDEWTTIGSFNLNQLSAYGSIELNLEIRSKAFSQSFAVHLETIIAQCERVTPETQKARSGIWSTFINWVSYHLVRIGLSIVTYIPYKRYFQ
ncbi:MAG: cardiolipin synthase [Parvicella sp.]|jgi:cardiolipin synthase